MTKIIGKFQLQGSWRSVYVSASRDASENWIPDIHLLPSLVPDSKSGEIIRLTGLVSCQHPGCQAPKTVSISDFISFSSRRWDCFSCQNSLNLWNGFDD